MYVVARNGGRLLLVESKKLAAKAAEKGVIRASARLILDILLDAGQEACFLNRKLPNCQRKRVYAFTKLVRFDSFGGWLL